MREDLLDVTEAMEAKSDQLNAIDLIAEPKTITITAIKKGTEQQKVVVRFEGDNNKPWMANKGQTRAMATLWGSKTPAWIGQKLTLYREPTVLYRGDDAGGIRISHATGINAKTKIKLVIAKGRMVDMWVEPLNAKPRNALSDEQLTSISQMIVDAQNMAELSVVAKTISEGYYDDEGKAKLLEVYQARSTAIRGEAS